MEPGLLNCIFCALWNQKFAKIKLLSSIELDFRAVYFWDQSLHGKRPQEILKRPTMENRLFSMNSTWIAKIYADVSPKTYLRVVETQAILFLKSISERVGSDIERFWILNDKSTIVSKSIEYDVIEIQSRSLSDPSLSDIDFKNKMAWVPTTLNR